MYSAAGLRREAVNVAHASPIEPAKPVSLDAVRAQAPNPCISPPAWEGKIFTSDSTRAAGEQYFKSFFVYDSANRRTASWDEFIGGRSRRMQNPEGVSIARCSRARYPYFIPSLLLFLFYAFKFSPAEKKYFLVIRLFNDHVEYVYDIKKKECSKHALLRPWRSWGIPQNATYDETIILGTNAFPNRYSAILRLPSR